MGSDSVTLTEDHETPSERLLRAALARVSAERDQLAAALAEERVRADRSEGWRARVEAAYAETTGRAIPEDGHGLTVDALREALAEGAREAAARQAAERERDEVRVDLAGCHVDLGNAMSSLAYRREAGERRAVSLRQSAASWRARAEALATAGAVERPPAPERHPLSQERSYASASPSDLPPAWRHDVWLSRVVSALHRAGFGDRVPDCRVVDEDAILTALDDLVAAARSRS